MATFGRRIGDRIRRRLWGGKSRDKALQEKGCRHTDQIQDVTPGSDGCEECLKLGDGWVHLRLCMSCGKVGCCDDSKNKHASAHFRESEHPIIRSLEPGEEWLWCYADEMLLSSPKAPQEKLPEGIGVIDED